ncbi:MAG: polyphosphate polymerase domain-containing protein [Candidatus Sericytochromatia bacterium]|nr:polyphosphate polymerase domain-containing protein [Candidatus Sericytochromatia bacterium]
MIRRFNRFELKYLLPLASAEALKADLAGQVDADSFSGHTGYHVWSLYYDSPTYEFFWDKIEGLKFRRKLRIRAYPDSDHPLESVMVEIKQRINKTVQKRRLCLPIEKAYELCTGQFSGMVLDPLDAAVVAEVKDLVISKNLRPSCLISYQRTAYHGNRYNPGLRITFDTELKARCTQLVLDPSPAVAAENRYFIPPDWCILEIKLNDKVPDWLVSLLNAHNCELRRVSKYCSGLAHNKAFQVNHTSLSPLILPEQPSLQPANPFIHPERIVAP